MTLMHDEHMTQYKHRLAHAHTLTHIRIICVSYHAHSLSFIFRYLRLCSSSDTKITLTNILGVAYRTVSFISFSVSAYSLNSFFVNSLSPRARTRNRDLGLCWLSDALDACCIHTHIINNHTHIYFAKKALQGVV